MFEVLKNLVISQETKHQNLFRFYQKNLKGLVKGVPVVFELYGPNDGTITLGEYSNGVIRVYTENVLTNEKLAYIILHEHRHHLQYTDERFLKDKRMQESLRSPEPEVGSFLGIFGIGTKEYRSQYHEMDADFYAEQQIKKLKSQGVL